MGRKVRKTLNIDGAKLKRVQRYLGVDTETEVIDRMLDAYDFERGLKQLARQLSSRESLRHHAAATWARSRTICVQHRDDDGS